MPITRGIVAAVVTKLAVVKMAASAARNVAGGGANKLKHMFGQSKHGLDALVKQFGSREAAYQAMQQASQAAVKAQKLTGVFETTVRVGAETITVRGTVVKGVVKIGTAFK